MFIDQKEMKQKIVIGQSTVWLILAVSMAATLAYWYVLSGIETAQSLSQFWQVIIWLVVGVGLVAEIIKKVTLSTFRNNNIWMTATFVSIVTVMGTYSILDQTRQNDLTKQSDSYIDSRTTKQQADTIAQQYAYAAAYNIESLEKQLDKVIVDRDNRRIKYNTYLKRKQILEKKISDKHAYDAAIMTSKAAQSNMSAGNALGSSSNPLLSNIAHTFHGSENLIKTLFYLLVTILLEVAAFWIGGQVEHMKLKLKLTEAELLDMKNQELFGFSVRDIQRDLFDRVNRSQLDALEAEFEVQKIRHTRKDKNTGGSLEAGAVAKQVSLTRKQATEGQRQAKQAHINRKDDNTDHVTPEAEPAGFGFISNNHPDSPKGNDDKKVNSVIQPPPWVTSKPTDNADSDAKASLKQNLDNGSAKPLKQGACTSAKASPKQDTIIIKKNAVKAEAIKQDKPVTRSITAVTAETTKEHFSDTDLLYPEWKEAVKNSDCRLTLRQCINWVKKTLNLHTSKQVNDVTDNYASTIVELLYQRGLNDKLIRLNPQWKKGSRIKKYLLRE